MDSNKPFISDGRIHAGRTIDERNHEIYIILSDLTDEEKGKAMFEYAKMKWYKARNAEYWDMKERIKPSTGDKKINI